MLNGELTETWTARCWRRKPCRLAGV